MRLYLTFVFGWLADMLAETGRFDEATVAARRALDWAETGESAGASMACRALARVAMAPGREGIDHALVHGVKTETCLPSLDIDGRNHKYRGEGKVAT